MCIIINDVTESGAKHYTLPLW